MACPSHGRPEIWLRSRGQGQWPQSNLTTLIGGVDAVRNCEWMGCGDSQEGGQVEGTQ
jgi:hypothetical protein